MSHTVCNITDSQVFGHLNEELDCRAERHQESDSEESRQISDSEEKDQDPDSEERDEESDTEMDYDYCSEAKHYQDNSDIVEGSDPLKRSCLIGQQNAIFHIVPCQNY